MIKLLMIATLLLLAACTQPTPPNPQPTAPPVVVAPTPPPHTDPTPAPAVGWVRVCLDGLSSKLPEYPVLIRGQPLWATIAQPCVTYPEPLTAGYTAEIVVHGGAWGLTATPNRQVVTVVAGETITARARVSWQ